jgi:hypothetical protein
MRNLLALLLCIACSRTPPPEKAQPSGEAVVTFKGGEVTRAELDREASRLPPLLMRQFQTPAGKRELAMSLADKKLLVEKARAAGLASDPEIRRQVTALEDRLVVQALLDREQHALAAPAEKEQRDYYESHKDELADPERLKLGRVVADSNAKAESLRKQLLAGKITAKDYGLFARGDMPDGNLERVAFHLKKPGEVSEVVEGKDGFSVLVLQELRPKRVPPFEEVRARILEKLGPIRQRKAFDDLREQLRKESDVKLVEGNLR